MSIDLPSSGKPTLYAFIVVSICYWSASFARRLYAEHHYISACQSSPTLVSCTSLTQTAKALKAHLESEGSELTIVLLPFLSAIYPPVEAPAPRELQLKPNPHTDALFGTAKDLRREGIDVLSPLECVLGCLAHLREFFPGRPSLLP